MKFIITKVNISENYLNEILDICDTKQDAVFKLDNYTNARKYKIEYKEDEKGKFIEEYEIYEGYLKNYKYLNSIYRIVEHKELRDIQKEEAMKNNA